MALQGYLKSSGYQALLKMSASLFKFLQTASVFCNIGSSCYTLHRSLLKITGIRLHAVLNQKIHEVHRLVKTVYKPQVTNDRGQNISLLFSPSSSRISFDYHGNLL